MCLAVVVWLYTLISGGHGVNIKRPVHSVILSVLQPA